MKLLLLALIAVTAFAAKSYDLRKGCEAIVSNTVLEDADRQTQNNIKFTVGFIVGCKHAYQTAYVERSKQSVHDGYSSVAKLCQVSISAYHDNNKKVDFIHLLSAVVAKDLSKSNRIEILAP